MFGESINVGSMLMDAKFCDVFHLLGSKFGRIERRQTQEEYAISALGGTGMKGARAGRGGAERRQFDISIGWAPDAVFHASVFLRNF